MQEKIEKFLELALLKSKISNTKAETASQLLFEIYSENKNIQWLAEQLFYASNVIASNFALRYISSLSIEEIKSLCDVMIKTINSNKLNLQVTFPVGLSVVAYGIQKVDDKTYFLQLLNCIIKLSEDKGKFNETKCKILKDHLFKKSSGKIFELDFQDWSENDRKRLYMFVSVIVSAEENLANIPYIKEINQWVKKYNLDTNPIPQVAGTNSVKKIEMSQPSTKEKLSEVSVPCKQVEIQKNNKNEPILNDNLVQELNKLFENAFVKNNAFKSLEDQITASRAEIIKLHEQIKDKDDSLAMLSAQKLSLETALNEKETELANVNERLKNSFAFDEAKKSQEIVTLKKDISLSLKLASEDYKEIMKTDTTETNDEFLKDIIMQIFKILNKFGISI